MGKSSKDSLAGAKSTRPNYKAGITPVLILCDNSGSMYHYVNIVNQCIIDLIQDLKANPVLSHKIDLRIVSFNTEYNEILPFTMVDQIDISKLKKVEQSKYATFLGAALSKAVLDLSDEKTIFKDSKADYTQPNLIVLSDGIPEHENVKETSKGIMDIQSKIANERWNCIPIFIGHDFDGSLLKEISVPDENGNKAVITFDSNNKKSDIIDAFKFASMSVGAVAKQDGGNSYIPMSTSALEKKIRQNQIYSDSLKPIKRTPHELKKEEPKEGFFRKIKKIF